MIVESRKYIAALLSEIGTSADVSANLAQILVVLAIFLTGYVLAWMLRAWLIPIIERIVERTETKWDDYLLTPKVLRAASQLIPAIFIYLWLPLCYDSDHATTYIALSRLTQVYITLTFTWLAYQLLGNLKIAIPYHTNEHKYQGIIMFAMVIVWCIGGIIAISHLLGYSPLRFIAGLGAMATVLMLVFKDTITGLVAGIQLSVNNMLKVGDWIQIDSMGVNGIVKEISLNTVKVLNFDNTMSTIPPYTLVSNTFHNWSEMEKIGCRRVKRSIYIDMSSIRPLSDEDRENLKHKKLLTHTEAEQQTLTNITAFRHYAANYLRHCSAVTDRQWILVRGLSPTPNGLPLEFWFYAHETEFVGFEEHASSLMEHFIATLPLFGLRAYQSAVSIGQ